MIIDNDTSEKFPIFEIPLDSSEASEVMGTKSKFWFLHPVMGRCLFKKVRAQSDVGEDWSEKIAAELCSLIKLPHADCELAIFNGERGVISSSFVPENGSIVHGNEILARILLEYPREVTNPSQHTLENISISFNLIYWVFTIRCLDWK